MKGKNTEGWQVVPRNRGQEVARVCMVSAPALLLQNPWEVLRPKTQEKKGLEKGRDKAVGPPLRSALKAGTPKNVFAPCESQLPATDRNYLSASSPESDLSSKNENQATCLPKAQPFDQRPVPVLEAQAALLPKLRVNQGTPNQHPGDHTGSDSTLATAGFSIRMPSPPVSPLLTPRGGRKSINTTQATGQSAVERSFGRSHPQWISQNYAVREKYVLDIISKFKLHPEVDAFACRSNR